ncbi:cell envelope biogenesis protein OmpA [Aquimarina algicola]|uniref:Cell envelope biogenesis protein OmpA n=1 Tax=Aquimarina algicola TaxID=2589995 RepID=A0A504JBE0_9FLAO|nr:cell envelope biogenesis protein OmpA [Aquimarina algicola]TPN83880.1 cell envelope biogenesis protein OmpA [Aquimarina algicola]
MEDKDKLKILKDLLLDEEKEFTGSIAEKVEELSKIVYKKEELSHKVDPIIDDKLDEFIEEIPKTLGPTITQTLKEEIKNSQDAVVEALFPIIGKMIKKYIAHEMRLLSENISRKTKSAFSFKNWFRRTKARAQGVTDGELAISDYAKPRLIQIFVIEKNSGILISDYSPLSDGTIDKEMIAGMLTAIKSFVEDAFRGGDQNLELIEYELHTIHIQNFYSYYVAAVISGAYTMMFKEVLEDQIIDFAKNHISNKELQNSTLFTKKLKKYFTDEIV